jgi:multicomponent Na+:H+ antiporter subunit G
MDLVNVISYSLFAIGSFFLVVAAIGIVRLPDFYTRMHAAGKSDTLGQSLILLGLIIHEGASFISIKIFFIILFIFIANPTATHAVAKAAFLSELAPWKKDGGKER